MTLTITLPDYVESRLSATAQAEGTDKETAAARVLADVFGALPTASAEEDTEAIREIGEALADAQAAQSRGELLTVEEALQKTTATLLLAHRYR